MTGLPQDAFDFLEWLAAGTAYGDGTKRAAIEDTAKEIVDKYKEHVVFCRPPESDNQ